ncbi:hypothetical protein PRZ48_014554 [Zasmidium cellare]|uniref:Uncharacterized protein n=1 Tax=Zasmidium cellare TaxID=395010 RepID=A0ABR0DZ26_ZASCE|nr:hypothetical protein PRZ48_014554 [Zasmidium cellare]
MWKFSSMQMHLLKSGSSSIFLCRAYSTESGIDNGNDNGHMYTRLIQEGVTDTADLCSSPRIARYRREAAPSGGVSGRSIRCLHATNNNSAARQDKLEEPTPDISDHGNSINLPIPHKRTQCILYKIILQPPTCPLKSGARLQRFFGARGHRSQPKLGQKVPQG